MRATGAFVAAGVQVELGHLFQGHALNAVDVKGRVSVPAGFRQLMTLRAAANNFDAENVLKIGEHKNGNCLTALDPVASAETNRMLAESVADLPADERYDVLEDKLQDTFGSLDQVTFDGAGRMVLSPQLRELGQIADLAFFVGAGLTFQIWNPLVAMAKLPETSRLRKPLAFLLKERGIVL